MSKRLLITVLVTLLGSVSLRAAEFILVASSRSNSLEEFTTSGTRVRTFASTGPYAPVALAQSPTTGEVFVTTTWASGPQAGQLTNTGRILRYQPNGSFYVDWDTFTVQCPNPVTYPNCPTTQTQSLLFDASGNLWVATAYGEDLNAPIYIFEYLAADLTALNPPAQPNPIVAQMFRGNQMAFNRSKNICIAGFIDQDVKCFDTSTRLQTADYYAEIHASSVSPVIEPIGLAFDPANRLYLTSVFGGQVAREVAPGGPIVLMATLTGPPNQLNGNLLVSNGGAFPAGAPPPACFPSCAPAGLYTTSFLPASALPSFSTPDPVYQITSGPTITKLISGTAPPGLGNDHIWGALWMIFLIEPTPF